mgnify:FL=1
MGRHPAPSVEGRQRRLVEELGEIGLHLDGSRAWHHLLVEELDYALRPKVHERRVPSFGVFIAPIRDLEAWKRATELGIEIRPLGPYHTEVGRRFADGLSSWLLRHADGTDQWAVFDRPAGSERDLVVLAGAFGATVVQRHPSGVVRVVGEFGVLRWEAMRWHHEPPISTWVDALPLGAGDDRRVLGLLLAFAVHDLGARNIGATLVYRGGTDGRGSYEARLPKPPELRIGRPPDLAPLRHVLSQVDGATMFDVDGVMTEIGVRLVPSTEAESDVAGLGGIRHTSARRYSFDDPAATVVVVSEDGPVTVLRGGRRVGSSAPLPPDEDDLDPDDLGDDDDDAEAEPAATAPRSTASEPGPTEGALNPAGTR